MEKTLPKGWEKKKLGEVANIRRGASPRPMGDPRYFGGNIPWIRISNIHKNGKFLKETEGHVTEEGAKRSVYLKAGSLIMAMAASIGTPCFLAVDGCIHDGFVVFEDLSAELDKEFLYHFIISFKNQFTNLAPEGTQKNLNTGIIKSAKIPLPPLPTQRKIVEILEEADNLRKLRKQADEKMKDLIPSLFVEMFGDPTTNPRGWEVKKLGDIAEIKSGGTPSRKKEEYFKGNITWVTSVSLNKPYLTIDDAKEFITEDAILNSATKLVTRKSVLFGNRVCVGNVSINLCDICFSQDVLAILYQEDLLIPEFLWFYLLQKKVYFERLTRGSTIKGVTVSVLHNTKIPLPPLPLQQEFAERVKEIEEEKERQAEGKKKLDELFNSLMQRAFKGELVA